jgi:hypothetical protein
VAGQGVRVRIWCFVPVGGSPAGDAMLAQKIALETMERRALAVTNTTGLSTDKQAAGLHHPCGQGEQHRTREGHGPLDCVEAEKAAGTHGRSPC